MGNDVFVHANALNESTDVGAGTRIWAFAHVMQGAEVGPNCNIGGHAFLESGARVGEGVTIKNGVAIWDGVRIESFAFVGPNAVFTNDKFPRSPRGPHVAGRYADRKWLEHTLVGEGATIGANATILCGITIGRYAMIAAGAIVTRDVKPFTLVVGSPATEVGSVCFCGKRVESGAEQVCEAAGRCLAGEA